MSPRDKGLPCKAAPELNQLSPVGKKQKSGQTEGSHQVVISSSGIFSGVSINKGDTHPKLLMTSPLWSPGSLENWPCAVPLGPPVMVGCGSLLWSEGHPVEWNKTASSQGYALHLDELPKWGTQHGEGNPHFSYGLRLWGDGFGAYFEELTVRLWKGTSIGNRTLSNSPGRTLYRLGDTGEVG